MAAKRLPAVTRGASPWTNWGNPQRSTCTERRGLIKPEPEDGRRVEIVVRGRLGSMGDRWGWELTAGNGLSAHCAYTHTTEQAALRDAERVGLVLLGLERKNETVK